MIDHKSYKLHEGVTALALTTLMHLNRKSRVFLYSRGRDLTPDPGIGQKIFSLSNDFFSLNRYFLGGETVILCGVVYFTLFLLFVFSR